MRTVRIALAGGLGNQLFQYAAGRALARRSGARLLLDTWSGFVRDRWFRRSYALAPLSLTAGICAPWQRLPIWLFRAETRWRAVEGRLVERPYGRFLVEQRRRFESGLDEALGGRSAWLVGYWQSPQYFADARDVLLRELMPPMPASPRVLALGAQMQAQPSVAVGLRLYEESSNPALHADGGRVKSMADVVGAVVRIASMLPGVQCYVFCTHRPPALDAVVWPAPVTWVTGDDGFLDPMDSLWLLTRCRHHVFTNSSFYWWGAYLSAAVSHSAQHVIAADNFLNRDGICPDWETF